MPVNKLFSFHPPFSPHTGVPTKRVNGKDPNSGSRTSTKADWGEAGEGRQRVESQPR